jgi:uncharacterized delta-60 repeat protein
MTAVFVLALVMAGSAAASSDGTLDPTFGSGGLVRTFFSAGGAGASDVIALPDGDLVTAGWAVTGISFPFRINIGFALVQYGPSGALDPGFGTAGTVITEFSDGNDQATALARQADGKLVAAGWAATDSTSSDLEFAIARYLPDGSLDGTFGAGGEVTTNLTPAADEIQDVAIDSAGRIVVAGFSGLGSFGGGIGDFAVARYNPDGTPDSSFGENGVRIIDFGGSLSSEDLAYGLALQADGKIVVVGTAGRATNGSFFQRGFALARLNSDGTLDPTFGANGLVLTLFGLENAEALGAAIDPDGRIVVSGSSGSAAPREGASRDFAFARYLADGTLDPSFGTAGTASFDFYGGGDEAADLTIQPNGKLIAGGAVQTSFGDVFAAVRLTTGGALDTSFGSGGKATAFTDGGNSTAEAVSLQKDGKIVLAGEAAGSGFGLARFNDAPADVTNPTLNVPAELTVDATSPGGANVPYNVTAHDDVDPNPVVVCAPVSGTTFIIGETTVNCTATDSSTNTGTASFVIHVRGAAEQVANLSATLDGLKLGKLGTSLHDKLVTVQSFLTANKPHQACASLADFIAQVNGQAGKGLTASQASYLSGSATRIENVIGC